MERLRIFNTTILDGPMTTNKNFYQVGMSNEEIRKDFMSRKEIVGKINEFRPNKLFIPIQKNSNKPDLYPDGKVVELTKEMIDSVDDLFDLDIYCDGVLLDSSNKGVVIGYPVADCPVVIAQDPILNKFVLGHCGCEYINRHLPEQLIDGLYHNTGIKDSDVKLYIGPCADFASFTYDTYPKWATDPIWDGCIIEEKGLYHIDMRRAIIRQFKNRNIPLENVDFNFDDTITDEKYYSNNSAHNGKKDKDGRFLTGAFYPDEKLKRKVLRF